MNRIARRAGALTVLILLLIAGFSFFLAEYTLNAADWVMHPGSPHVYADANIKTGAVTDRDGILLLNMQKEGWSYSSSDAIRKATMHWVGDREGMIRALVMPAYYEEVLGYDFINGLYTFGKDAGTGGVMELTLSSKLQTVALDALGEYKGTVGVYNYKTGQILCAVTTPTYDPDAVPDVAGDPVRYEGAYMNRFLQSAYTPGSIFKIVTLAAALESMENAESLEFICTGSWGEGESPVTCEKAHGQQSLKQAFANSCNCAFAELARQMGGKTLQQYVEKFRVTQPVSFDGITTAQGNFDLDEYYITLGWSAIGQHTDLLNPCTYMTFIGAIAGGGRAVIPYVVESAHDGENGYQAKVQYADSVMSSETAAILRQYMRYAVEYKYGADNFPGLTVCAKTGTAEKDGEKASNAMFTGFVTDEAYPLAFIICVEDGGYGASTCVPIASEVLTACKELIDMQP